MAFQKWQTPTESLSKRAIEILALLAEGLSDREIAERLVMTINTVKWYNRQIYSILDVGSRTQAIARARELQLLRNEPDDSFQIVRRTPRHGLPVEATHFIGRKHEILEGKHLLEATRLLTLVGPPGTGKTRLAVQIGWAASEQFQDEVYFVSLSPISDSSLVANLIAGAVEVSEVHGQPLMETLKEALRERHMLLILDNFEHLLPAGRQIAELLSAAPHLKVLATSREPLHLYGEQEYAVPPLTLPDPENPDLHALAACESTALFVQRARAVRADFELTEQNAQDVAAICVHLDGLPLAIELAAARIKFLTPQALLTRLSSRLDTLTAGAQDVPTRQRTLRNTIEWSYNLLDDDEKALFERLAVFAGGWSMDAAESVCAENLPIPVLDGLASLLDKSLIQQSDDDDEPRFAMLETIREYALERLEASGQAEHLRAQFIRYFIAFAEDTGNALYSRYRSEGLTRLEVEQNNFRAALSWSLAVDPEPGLRLIAALGACWRIRSYLIEGYNWSERLLEAGVNAAPEVRANALSSTSRLLACYLGNYAEADQMSHEAIGLARKSGNSRSIAEASYARGTALMETNLTTARSHFDEALALFQNLEDHWGIAQTMNVIGEVHRLQGDDRAAEEHYRQALDLYKHYGNPWGANIVLQNLAYIAQHRDDYEQARALFTEGLANSQELADKVAIANCLCGLAGVYAAMGEPDRGARLLGAAEVLRETTGAHIQAGDRPDYEKSLALTRDQLDAEAFDAAWAEGRGLSLEQMVAVALEPIHA